MDVIAANRTYLTQASDETESFGLMSRSACRAVFKLNCLLFDRIAIPASGILANRWLLEAARDEPDALRLLYRLRAKGGLQVVEPILAGELSDLSSVADAMIESGTGHAGVSDDDLREHARFIDAASFGELWLKHEEFRARFYENLKEVVHLVNRDGLSAWQGRERMHAANDLDLFERWIDNVAPRDDLRCTQVYEVVDAQFLDMRQALRVMTASVYHATIAGTQNATMSSPGDMIPYIDCLDAAKGVAGRYVLDHREMEHFDIPVSLPLGAIDSIPFTDICAIRSFKSTQRVRQQLVAFRQDPGSVSRDELYSSLSQLRDSLLDYADTTDTERAHRLALWRRADTAVMLRLWMNRLRVIPLVVSFVLASHGGLAVATLWGIVDVVASEVLSKRAAGNNAVRIQRRVTHDYSPSSGSVVSMAKPERET